MKVILIPEEEFKGFLDQLKLESYELRNSNFEGIPQGLQDSIIREVKRRMQYIFVNWAQKHGASCT